MRNYKLQSSNYKQVPNSKLRSVGAALLVLLLFLFLPAAPLSGAETAITDCLPKAGELGHWKPADDMEHMKGEDLFLLINGGAEVYHEYGFKEVIAQGFKNNNKKSFNLEIFRMTSKDAAYGIYTFKTGDEGKLLDIGDEGLLEEYYLNFRKGSYLVTITGFDSQQETLDGLVKAARLIASKIEETGKPPALLRGLPEDFNGLLKPYGVTYLKGPLSLFNHYQFDSKDIFSLKEGAVARYNGFRLFLLKYKNRNEAGKQFKFASSFLSQSTRFTGFTSAKSHFTMMDREKCTVFAKTHGEYIFILVISPDHSRKPEELTEKIVTGLDKIAKEQV